MKIKILFAFILAVTLSAQTNSNKDIVTTRFLNGNIKTYGEFVNGVKDGIYQEYYESGNIWKDWNFVDGLEQGTSLWYFEDGTISMRWNYVHGKLEGKSQWYYESGELWS